MLVYEKLLTPIYQFTENDSIEQLKQERKIFVFKGTVDRETFVFNGNVEDLLAFHEALEDYQDENPDEYVDMAIDVEFINLDYATHYHPLDGLFHVKSKVESIEITPSEYQLRLTFNFPLTSVVMSSLRLTGGINTDDGWYIGNIILPEDEDEGMTREKKQQILDTIFPNQAFRQIYLSESNCPEQSDPKVYTAFQQEGIIYNKTPYFLREPLLDDRHGGCVIKIDVGTEEPEWEGINFIAGDNILFPQPIHKPAPVLIYVVTPPDEEVFYTERTVDWTGLVINLVYSDGTEEEVTDYTTDPEDGWLIPFDYPTGTKTVTVYYEGLTTTFDIEIENGK